MVWKRLAQDVSSPFPHVASYELAAVTRLKKIIGRNDESWLFECRNRKWFWCGNPEDFEKQARTILKKLEDSAFFELLEPESRRTIKEFEEMAWKLKDKNTSEQSDAELVNAYEELFDAWTEMNAWGHVLNLSDFEFELLSKRVSALLERRIKESGSSVSVADAFTTLTTPLETSPLAKQDEDFLELLVLIQERARESRLFLRDAEAIAKNLAGFPEIKRALQEHVKKYDWLQYHYDGPTVLDESYFIQALSSEIRQGADGKKILQERRDKKRSLKQTQESLEKELGLNDEERYWVNVAKTFAFLKLLRKDAVFEASCWSGPLLDELGKRLGLDRLQVRHMTPQEIREAVEQSSVDKAEMQERVRSCIVYFDEKGVKFYTGEEAEELATQITEEEVTGASELKGSPASPGKAKGVVKIVIGAEDMPKMNEGDILVSPATNPNLVPAMKKAAAIVTNEGGITCHAAIVSRELGVPCVVGTKVATRALKDGDLVEVDADQGVVKKL